MYSEYFIFSLKLNNRETSSKTIGLLEEESGHQVGVVFIKHVQYEIDVRTHALSFHQQRRAKEEFNLPALRKNTI